MTSLPMAQRSTLETQFSGRVSFRKGERKLYGHDIAAMPGLVKPLIGNTVPDAVVQPESEAELVQLVRWAAANKIPGIRAGLCHDSFSARQGVEDDDANILCLGARVIGRELAWEVVRAFLAARFSGAERHRRRLAKIAAMERRFTGGSGGDGED